jgi:hypothetical protein
MNQFSQKPRVIRSWFVVNTRIDKGELLLFLVRYFSRQNFRGKNSGKSGIIYCDLIDLSQIGCTPKVTSWFKLPAFWLVGRGKEKRHTPYI